MEFNGWPGLSLFSLGTPPPELSEQVHKSIEDCWQKDEEEGETPQNQFTSTEKKKQEHMCVRFSTYQTINKVGYSSGSAIQMKSQGKRALHFASIKEHYMYDFYQLFSSAITMPKNS